MTDNINWATLTLKSTETKNPQQHHLSPSEITVIGRSPDCQIALNPHECLTVSRRHAEFKVVDGNWQIKDLNTTNGTLVNDRFIQEEQQLTSGDRITLGKTGPQFCFECLELNATVMIESSQMTSLGVVPKTPPVKSEVSAVATPPEPELELPSKPQEESTPVKAKVEEITSSQPSQIILPSKATIPEQSLATGKTLWNLVSITELGQLLSDSEAILALAFSPDGKLLASGSQDQTIKLWNLANYSEITSFTGNKLAIKALAFSPDGKLLASSGADQTIKLWNIAEQRETASFTGHKLAINALAFSPDGKLLASGSQDQTIKLWNLADQSEIAMLAGHKQGIDLISFNPDGTVLASGSVDQTIKTWNLTTQEEMVSIVTPNWQGAIAISSDGKTLASSDEQGVIKLWQI